MKKLTSYVRGIIVCGNSFVWESGNADEPKSKSKSEKKKKKVERRRGEVGVYIPSSNVRVANVRVEDTGQHHHRTS